MRNPAPSPAHRARRSCGRALARGAPALGLVAMLAVGGCSESDQSGPTRAPATGALALEHVSVVDPRDGQVLADRTVVIDGGEIVEVAPVPEATVPGSARRVDATGKFVVPGYLEMHAHVLGEDDPEPDLALMLANGITGFRQMNGSDELLELRRTAALPVSERTPALLAMPGQVLTAFNARNPEAAVATVREQAALGADFIKVGMVGPEVLSAVLEEAGRLGLPVAGHVPFDVSVRAASEGGMASIEHLGPTPGVSVACSTDEAALMASASGIPGPLGDLPFALPFADFLANLVLSRIIVNPTMLMTPAAVDRLRRILATYDADRCRAVAREFAANGTWHVPTLIRQHTSRLADAPEHRGDPNLRYVEPERAAAWQETTERFVETFPPEDRQALKDQYAQELQVVGLLDAEGVRMLAGSDSGGAGWLVPGFSLHQEFDELEKAGVSPLHVLQMTTINGAEFLGRTTSLGTVEPGKAADLVLLDANPIESVQNLHRIAGVVRAGTYHSAEDLETLKREVEAHAATD